MPKTEKRKGFPSDKERLAAIKRTQEETRVPEGADGAVAKALLDYHQARPVIASFLEGIFGLAHRNEKKSQRRKIFRSAQEENGLASHIAQCPQCSEVFEGVMKHLDLEPIMHAKQPS